MAGGKVRHTCSVSDCGRPCEGSGLCSKHYQRLRRTGVTAGRPARLPCLADGCERLRYAFGYCEMHWERVRKHGTTAVTIQERRGPQNPAWAGASCSYAAAHYRVKSAHGRAAEWRCSSCADQAQEWAYLGGSDAASTELWGSSWVEFSPDPEDYVPLCIRCHRKFDARKRVNNV